MDKPLATFCLLSYNQESFIRSSVEAALAQTYSPLEIIISDDCSKDQTFEIMKEIIATYHGPHTIILRRNEKNLGLAEHINSVMALAKGEFIIGAAGDDLSVPWRTEVLVNHFLNNPECVLAGSHTQVFGDHHHVSALLVDPDCRDLVTRCRYVTDGIQGCTFAYRRSLIECFPPLEKTTQIEDIILAFRAWEIGTFEVLPDILVLYRTHGKNLSCTRDKHETIAYQVKMHCSVIDQMCVDIKRMDRAYAEIAPALIFLKKRELYLLNSLIWHRNPSLWNNMQNRWGRSKLKKFLIDKSLWKSLRRNRERKELITKVISNWKVVLNNTEGSRCLPPHLLEIAKNAQELGK